MKFNLYTFLLPPPGYRKASVAFFLSLMFAVAFFTGKMTTDDLMKALGGIFAIFSAGNGVEHIGRGIAQRKMGANDDTTD